MGKANAEMLGKVASWLQEQGYRLEYETYAAFRQAGLHALLGEYLESTEGKAREIDVSSLSSERRKGRDFAVRVLCECKYSADHPWVLLMTDELRAHLGADLFSLPRSPALSDIDAAMLQFKRELEQCWHFSPKMAFAHALVQALRSNKDNRDQAYEALQKVANAGWDAVTQQNVRQHGVFMFAIPCLVVEAPLLQARFSQESGEFIVEPVPYGRLSWSGCRSGTVVDVVHHDALPEYAKQLFLTIGTLMSGMLRISDQMSDSSSPASQIFSIPR